MVATLEIQPWYGDVPRSTRRAKLCGIVVIAGDGHGLRRLGQHRADLRRGHRDRRVRDDGAEQDDPASRRRRDPRDSGARGRCGGEPARLLVTARRHLGARAELRRLLLKQIRLEAIEARLQAEAAGKLPSRIPPAPSGAEWRPGHRGAAIGRSVPPSSPGRTSIASDIAAYQKGIDGLEEKITGSKHAARRAASSSRSFSRKSSPASRRPARARLYPQARGACAPARCRQSPGRGRPDHRRYRRCARADRALARADRRACARARSRRPRSNCRTSAPS